MRTLLNVIIDVLILGIPWRAVSKLKISENIHWNTFYKTNIKLIKDDVIRNCSRDTTSRYLKSKPASKLKIRTADTTTVPDKLGKEKVARGKHHENKKVPKIPLITDSRGIP